MNDDGAKKGSADCTLDAILRPARHADTVPVLMYLVGRMPPVSLIGLGIVISTHSGLCGLHINSRTFDSRILDPVRCSTGGSPGTIMKFSWRSETGSQFALSI